MILIVIKLKAYALLVLRDHIYLSNGIIELPIVNIRLIIVKHAT